MIRIFTTCIIDDYKAQQVVAGKLVKSINLVLLKELDSTDQEKLKAVGQHYKNSFDRFFVGDIAQPMLEGFHQCLEMVQKKGSTAGMQATRKKESESV